MEEKLVKEYIGENADKIMNDSVNFRAAILGQIIGPVWFFYRKSCLIGFAFIILTFVIGYLADSLGVPNAYCLMFFIYLFTANKIYIWDVKRKVERIIKTNSNLSEEELLKKAKNKGGVSAISAVIYSILVFVVIALSAAVFYTIISNNTYTIPDEQFFRVKNDDYSSYNEE